MTTTTQTESDAGDAAPGVALLAGESPDQEVHVQLDGNAASPATDSPVLFLPSTDADDRHPTTPASDSSSVHTKETSGSTPPPLDYRDWINRYSDPKELAVTHRVLEQILDPHSQRLNRLRKCRSYARFYRNIETDQVKVISSMCHDRWCPTCAHAKATRIAERVAAWAMSKPSPKMLTLTLRSSDAPLNYQIKTMVTAFKRLRKEPEWKENINGGIWFFQVTYNPLRQQWHPHLHAVLDASFILQATLARLWSKLTHGSRIVDIRNAANASHVSKYVSRYVSRPLLLKDLPHPRRLELVEQTTGVRFVNTFGNAHKAGLLHKDPMNFKEWELLDSWYQVSLDYLQSPRATEIWHAWLDNKPLAKSKLDEIASAEHARTIKARASPDAQQLDLPLEGETASLWMTRH